MLQTEIRRMMPPSPVSTNKIVNNDFENSELLLNFLHDIALFADKSFESQVKLMPLANTCYVLKYS